MRPVGMTKTSDGSWLMAPPKFIDPNARMRLCLVGASKKVVKFKVGWEDEAQSNTTGVF